MDLNLYSIIPPAYPTTRTIFPMLARQKKMPMAYSVWNEIHIGQIFRRVNSQSQKITRTVAKAVGVDDRPK
jgi:hypothetical protein